MGGNQALSNFWNWWHIVALCIVFRYIIQTDDIRLVFYYKFYNSFMSHNVSMDFASCLKWSVKWSLLSRYKNFLFLVSKKP